MSKISLILICLLLWAALISGALLAFQKSKETKKEISFTTLDRGIQSGLNVPLRKVVKEQKNWEDLWAEIHPIIENNPSLARPAVDFDKEMVLAIFMGFKSTGGYTTEIIKIIETKNALEVTILEKGPESNTIVTQAFTSPYYLAKTSKINKSVVFAIEKEPLDSAPSTPLPRLRSGQVGTGRDKPKERPKLPSLIPQTLQNRLNPLN